jgi:hypothetical protein
LLIEVSTRTDRHPEQRFELCVAAKIHWPMRFALMSAPKLVYLHSLGGTGHVAPTMALCIGCVRLVTFGDPTAIVWLDVSRSGGRATARHTGNGNRHLRFEVYQGLARKGP